MNMNLIPYLKNFISFTAGAEAAKMSLIKSNNQITLQTLNNVEITIKQKAKLIEQMKINDADQEYVDIILQLGTYCMKLLCNIEKSYGIHDDIVDLIAPTANTKAFVSGDDNDNENNNQTKEKKMITFQPISVDLANHVLNRQPIIFEILLMTGIYLLIYYSLYFSILFSLSVRFILSI